MSQYESWSLIASLAGVLVNALLFIGFALQLFTMRAQLQEAQMATLKDHERRRQQATIEYYASSLEYRSQLHAKLPSDLDEKAIHSIVVQSYDDAHVRERISNYLAIFELLATGVNAGVFDEGVIQRLAARRIVALASNYEPFILARRKETGNPNMYAELVNLSRSMAVRLRPRVESTNAPQEP